MLVRSFGVHSGVGNLLQMNWNSKIKYAAVPMLAISLSACVTVQAPAADGSDVKLGQEAVVDGPRIKPVAILEDSRCPMNARCIWAGRVRLKMLWIRPAGNREFEITLGEPKSLADGKITLTSARPDKRTDVKLKPSDYRFSFEFQGGL